MFSDFIYSFETLLVLRTKRRTASKCAQSSCKVPVILSDFSEILIFSIYILEITQI